MKIQSVKTLKNNAWTLFSKYIRLKDANFQGYVKCVTCNVYRPYKEMHAGHYIHGKTKTLYFDERNVHPQCLTKESNLRTFSGKYKSINDMKVGDKLWGFHSKTFDRMSCVVISVDKFIPDELYEVSLSNGTKFFSTPDHKIVANGRWVEISEILHTYSTYDILEL